MFGRLAGDAAGPVPALHPWNIAPPTSTASQRHFRTAVIMAAGISKPVFAIAQDYPNDAKLLPGGPARKGKGEFRLRCLSCHPNTICRTRRVLCQLPVPKISACVRAEHRLETIASGSGCGSVVECGLPKPEMRVRFPSPAPTSRLANELNCFCRITYPGIPK